MNDHTCPETPGIESSQSPESSTAETAAPPPAELSPPPGEPTPTNSPQPPELDRAGFWLRLVAFVIDLSLLTIFALFLLFVSLLISSMGIAIHSFAADAANSFSLSSLCKLTQVVATAAYFTILHGETGQTIGKNLLGLRVCTVNGEPLGYSRALIRFLAYGLSF